MSSLYSGLSVEAKTLKYTGIRSWPSLSRTVKLLRVCSTQRFVAADDARWRDGVASVWRGFGGAYFWGRAGGVMASSRTTAASGARIWNGLREIGEFELSEADACLRANLNIG